MKLNVDTFSGKSYAQTSSPHKPILKTKSTLKRVQMNKKKRKQRIQVTFNKKECKQGPGYNNVEKPSELEMCHNLISQVKGNDGDCEYAAELAMVIARSMVDINEGTTIKGASFGQQYMLKKGLKVFGDKGSQATSKELDQLHKRNCFTPIAIADLTQSEKRKAMEALMFLTEKRDKTVKGRMVYNGKPTREWLDKEDSASPTVALESIMLTAVIDAKEERDVMSADVSNAFIQTPMPERKNGEERVVMKITGVLVDLLVQLAPDVYGPFVVYEKGRKVLYVQVLRAISWELTTSQ